MRAYRFWCIIVHHGDHLSTIYRPSIPAPSQYLLRLSLRCRTYLIASLVHRAFLLTDDVNIRLELSTDSETRQFTDILAAYGLAHCSTSATHNLGGALDVITTLRTDLPPLHVDVKDADLSDHRLRWTMPLVRPTPVYFSTTSR